MGACFAGVVQGVGICFFAVFFCCERAACIWYCYLKGWFGLTLLNFGREGMKLTESVVGDCGGQTYRIVRLWRLISQ